MPIFISKDRQLRHAQSDGNEMNSSCHFSSVQLGRRSVRSFRVMVAQYGLVDGRLHDMSALGQQKHVHEQHTWKHALTTATACPWMILHQNSHHHHHQQQQQL